METESRLDPIALDIREAYLWVTLRDRRVIGTPLDALPWLRDAQPEQQQDYQFIAEGILWDSLDEGLDVSEMLAGYTIKS